MEIYFVHPQYNYSLYSVDISKKDIQEYFLGNKTYFANLYRKLEDKDFTSSTFDDFIKRYYSGEIDFKIVIATPKDTMPEKEFLEVDSSLFDFYLTEHQEFIFNVKFKRERIL